MDKELYHLTISVNKALNSLETPLKTKHARFVIICTHRMKETKSFWAAVCRQPLMENRFVSWKFCHLLHKVLQEGHTSALNQSQTHKKMIHEMGKLWGHLEDDVGACILSYSKFLVSKLNFHDKYAIFPGSFVINFTDLEKNADVDLFFQLCVELLDYLDDILDVQSHILKSIIIYRTSSMTPQGQCRLAPLVPLIQETLDAYNLCVKIMFKLHNCLPYDTLLGHRDRFKGMYAKLQGICDSVRPLQYFQDLIRIDFQNNYPNFTSELNSYTPPVVEVTSTEIDQPMENLIDTCFLNEDTISESTSNMQHLNSILKEKEETIFNYQQEVDIKTNNLLSLQLRYENDIKDKDDTIKKLLSELNSTKEVTSRILKESEEANKQLVNTTILTKKIAEEEERNQQSTEKFEKLKTMYTQIRNDHINLIRQNADASKELTREKHKNSEQQQKILQLADEMKELEGIKEKYNAIITENNQLKNDQDACLLKLNSLQSKQFEFKLKVDGENATHQSEIQQLQATISKYEIDLKDFQLTSNKAKLLQNEVHELKATIEENALNYSKHLENLMLKVSESETEIHNLRCTGENTVKILNKELDNNKELLDSLQRNIENNIVTIANLNHELASHKTELQNLQTEDLKMQTQLQDVLEKNNTILEEKRQINSEFNALLASNWFAIINALKKNVVIKDDYMEIYENSRILLKNMDAYLEDLVCERSKFTEMLKTNLLETLILFVFDTSTLYCHNTLMYFFTPNLDHGEVVYNKTKAIILDVHYLLTYVEHDGMVNQAVDCIESIKGKIKELLISLQALEQTDKSAINIADMMANELEEMDNSIKEAADKIVDMLSNSRSKDIGIKLKVNEQILDSCTTLMKCIMVLIKKSKTLQEEIVAAGRGKTSVNEFYKRNSKWTEGLISAAKSVAKAANYLVDAANKAVTSESNIHFDIIVAAQEIAASTAQLVIASKVKANRNSENLSQLTKASKDVSHATGAVVATVRDINNQMDQIHEVDLSKLTSSQAKTMEMDIHVKVLELEQALQMQRMKLATFRRNQYKNVDD